MKIIIECDDYKNEEDGQDTDIEISIAENGKVFFAIDNMTLFTADHKELTKALKALEMELES